MRSTSQACSQDFALSGRPAGRTAIDGLGDRVAIPLGPAHGDVPLHQTTVFSAVTVCSGLRQTKAHLIGNVGFAPISDTRCDRQCAPKRTLYTIWVVTPFRPPIGRLAMLKHPPRRHGHELQVERGCQLRRPDPYPRIGQLFRREHVRHTQFKIRVVDPKICGSNVGKLVAVREDLDRTQLLGQRAVQHRHERTVVQVSQLEPRPETNQGIIITMLRKSESRMYVALPSPDLMRCGHTPGVQPDDPCNKVATIQFLRTVVRGWYEEE